MPWRPLPRIAFAVATYPFSASSPADLPLELGDELYIIEQGGADGSWYRGYLVAPPSLLAGLTSVKGQTLEARVFSGIFPRCCVEVREVLGDVNSEEKVNSYGLNNGEAAYLNTNGGPHRGPTSGSRNGVRHSLSRNGSLRTKNSFTNEESPQDSGIGNGFSRSPSQRNPEKLNSQVAKRKISQRSAGSRRSLGSSLPITPGSASPRVPSQKRPSAPVPMLKIGDETPTSFSEPLVDEIASCLREWHSKNLHELLLTRRYSVLERISDLVYKLDLSRRQLLYGVLTPQELHERREKTVWDLVSGNKMLSKEIIVRDPAKRGRLLIGDDSVIEMTKLQSTMSLLDNPPIPQQDPINLSHLMVDVKSFAKSGVHMTAINISLYSRKTGGPPKQLTESFAMDVPSQEVFSKVAALGKFRTLFTDLSSSEIGEVAGSDAGLYLVIKVQVNLPVESTMAGDSRKPVLLERNLSPPASDDGMSSKSPSIKAGRKSMLWAPKHLGSIRHRGQQDSRSSHTAHSIDSLPTSRPKTQENARPETRPGPQFIKRNVGVGVLNIKQLLGHGKTVEAELSIWSPAGPSIDVQNVREEFDQLTRDLMTSRNGHFVKCDTLDHIRLSLHAFESPDAHALIIKTPTLLQNISRTPKIGFPGTPITARSDIYLTLSEAFLPPQALLSHPERGTVQIASSLDLKNVQLTIEVRKRSGERIEQCIYPSSNSPGLTAWRTCAASRGESWNQMIKLVIPSDDVPDAHLIMSLADAPNFPFALSWMPLWDEEAFIKDGPHTPLLYLYDKLTSSSDKGRGAYLAFPWNSRGSNNASREEVLTGPVATLNLETYLCSTVFSQDKVLLGILRWRELPKDQIIVLLRRFMFVSEIEIVKLVDDVFDALFSILVEHSGKDEFEDLVFDALVTVLGIVHDRRFNLGPLVDEYTEMRFDYPFATSCLIRSYLRLLAKPADSQNSRRLRATFKVGRQMLKFIISARRKQIIKEADIGITNTQPTFSRDVRSIFKALEALMKDASPILIGSKTLVVQHLHTWIPELQRTFSEEEIFQIAINFLDSCEGVKSKLLLYKLVLILHLTKLNIFANDNIRYQLLTHTLRWTQPHWGTNVDKSDQWREQVRLCCSIASNQIDEFGVEASSYFVKVIQSYSSLQASNRVPHDSLSLLFPSSYPFPSKIISAGSKFDEALIELAAVLAQLANIPFAKPFNQPLPELADTLSTALEVIKSILSGEAFPSSWLSLHIYHHKSSLHILESLFQPLVTNFVPAPDDADYFNMDLWSKFLLTLLTLVRSDTLALETFAEQKRRAVWKIAGDVREQGADLLRRSWEAIGWDSSSDDQTRYGLARLGGYQVQYVPSLVAPIVELCLSVHEGLRGVAVRIFQTMIVSEWTLSGDLSVIEAEMINCLDLMFKSKKVSEVVLQKLFIMELLDLFEVLSQAPNNPLWDAIQGLVSTMDTLLDLLGAVHSPDITESFRIMHTLQLMDFLRDMRKDDIYIRYVHQLADVQAQLQNPTEAGLALRLHADLYEWDTTVVDALKDPPFPEQTSFERKEQLYFEMIKYYEEGTAWDCALASYRELANRYEYDYYDFAKLARTQRSMAKIYEAIARGERNVHRYFRVVYKGLGFPSGLRDKQFIYEGSPTERQSMFTDRMRQQHPTAQILSSVDPENLEGQYLQIFAVNPHRDLEHHVYQQSRVPQPIREHLLLSKSDRFAVTSRRHSPTTEVKDQWIEKTVYVTTESFPNILRRSEIVSTQILRLSPLQTAIERTSRKTSEIALLDKRIRDGDGTGIPSLTEAIKSSVDPSVATSVAQYRQLLPEQTDFDDADSAEEPTIDPLQNALKLALVDHVSTLKHSLTLYSRFGIDQPALLQNFYSTFSPEIAILNPKPNISPSHTPIPTSSHLVPASPSTTASHPPPQIQNGDPASTQNPQRNTLLSLNFLKSPPKPSLTNGNNASAHSSSNDTESEARASMDGSAVAKSSVGGDEERPMTARSGRSGKVKKRLSLLGIGRGGSREKDKVKGMGGLREE